MKELRRGAGGTNLQSNQYDRVRTQRSVTASSAQAGKTRNLDRTFAALSDFGQRMAEKDDANQRRKDVADRAEATQLFLAGDAYGPAAETRSDSFRDQLMALEGQQGTLDVLRGIEEEMEAWVADDKDIDEFDVQAAISANIGDLQQTVDSPEHQQAINEMLLKGRDGLIGKQEGLQARQLMEREHAAAHRMTVELTGEALMTGEGISKGTISKLDSRLRDTTSMPKGERQEIILKHLLERASEGNPDLFGVAEEAGLLSSQEARNAMAKARDIGQAQLDHDASQLTSEQVVENMRIFSDLSLRVGTGQASHSEIEQSFRDELISERQYSSLSGKATNYLQRQTLQNQEREAEATNMLRGHELVATVINQPETYAVLGDEDQQLFKKALNDGSRFAVSHMVSLATQRRLAVEAGDAEGAEAIRQQMDNHAAELSDTLTAFQASGQTPTVLENYFEGISPDRPQGFIAAASVYETIHRANPTVADRMMDSETLSSIDAFNIRVQEMGEAPEDVLESFNQASMPMDSAMAKARHNEAQRQDAVSSIFEEQRRWFANPMRLFKGREIQPEAYNQLRSMRVLETKAASLIQKGIPYSKAWERSEEWFRETHEIAGGTWVPRLESTESLGPMIDHWLDNSAESVWQEFLPNRKFPDNGLMLIPTATYGRDKTFYAIDRATGSNITRKNGEGFTISLNDLRKEFGTSAQDGRIQRQRRADEIGQHKRAEELERAGRSSPTRMQGVDVHIPI